MHASPTNPNDAFWKWQKILALFREIWNLHILSSTGEERHSFMGSLKQNIEKQSKTKLKLTFNSVIYIC